ncbi:hypothetical protein BDW75DRAFT_141685 [Aspergillus navahoensis]
MMSRSQRRLESNTSENTRIQPARVPTISQCDGHEMWMRLESRDEQTVRVHQCQNSSPSSRHIWSLKWRTGADQRITTPSPPKMPFKLRLCTQVKTVRLNSSQTKSEGSSCLSNKISHHKQWTGKVLPATAEFLGGIAFTLHAACCMLLLASSIATYQFAWNCWWHMHNLTSYINLALVFRSCCSPARTP